MKTEQLFEVFNNSADYVQTSRGTMNTFKFFVTDEGQEYQVVVDILDINKNDAGIKIKGKSVSTFVQDMLGSLAGELNNYMIGFETRSTEDYSGGTSMVNFSERRNTLLVLNTVVEIIKDFLGSRRDSTLLFKPASGGHSRVYEGMIKRLGTDQGVEFFKLTDGPQAPILIMRQEYANAVVSDQ